eukprot:CAMPEP_0197594682 /NCGR_PEP_ID=MMETSP1326-20131121/21171_1 /TAXON_ID=1155430 /ORGANISM="Genus nov. species nov., Strain RCC2288" /LENGTH=45 /DNA_ID= /DNA_START= /DNA_END= /DNA_ORIENTATION=
MADHGDVAQPPRFHHIFDSVNLERATPVRTLLRRQLLKRHEDSPC